MRDGETNISGKRIADKPTTPEDIELAAKEHGGMEAELVGLSDEEADLALGDLSEYHETSWMDHRKMAGPEDANYQRD